MPKDPKEKQDTPQFDEHKAEEVLGELAGECTPEQIEQLDEQFERKLQRVEPETPKEMLDQLRVMWRMLRGSEELAWTKKALIMGAIMYFVSPIDLIPDGLGKAGYLDDAMIVRVVYNRLSDEIAAFRAQQSE
jgi:uncharacterized membrane protein YkvA (DUF1232 family)